MRALPDSGLFELSGLTNQTLARHRHLLRNRSLRRQVRMVSTLHATVNSCRYPRSPRYRHRLKVVRAGSAHRSRIPDHQSLAETSV